VTAQAVMVLGNELRRLRASVEAVRALPVTHEPYRDYVDRDDVLRILEAE